VHIGAKKEDSKRPWVAGFVYLCSSFRPLAWRRPWRGRGRQGKERAGGRGRKELEGVSKSERVTSKSEPGRDGGRPLVGRASEFQPLHCGVRRLHFSAKRAAPGTRIVENKRK